MAEYIERGTAVAWFMPYVHTGDRIEVDVVISDIKGLPAANVAPVVHALWIPCEPDSDVRFYCSECETEVSTSWDYDCDEMWSFCPHCGAKMDAAADGCADACPLTGCGGDPV